MTYLVFDYDNKVVTAVYGTTDKLPPKNDDYAFKREWVTLSGPFFGERAVRGLGYYRMDKTLDEFVPTLFFALLDEQFEVRTSKSPRTLDPRLAIR